MAEVPKETQHDILQLQNLQRQLQLIAVQKQRFTIESSQIDDAKDALKKADGKTYKAIGTLLIESSPPDMEKELTENKENLETRLKSLEKQENKLRERVESLQKKVETALGKSAKPAS
jgi:prefoldin beta subunit